MSAERKIKFVAVSPKSHFEIRYGFAFEENVEEIVDLLAAEVAPDYEFLWATYDATMKGFSTDRSVKDFKSYFEHYQINAMGVRYG